jgi:hypothetical protein
MEKTAFSAITEASPLPKRILANLKAQVSWIDSRSGEKISIAGVTENVSESGVLVNIEVLPTVGTDVKLRLYDDKKTIIETQTTVIRVGRDPSRPVAALSAVKNFRKWKEDVMNAAQEWVNQNLRLNYEEEWAN